MGQQWKGGREAAQKRYRETNREEVNRRNREWYHRNRDTELAKRRQYFYRNKEHIYVENAKWQRNKRKELFAQIVIGYGGKCACCGEAEILFLEVDHINNDGAEERKRFNKSTLTFYQWLIEQGYPKDRYQLLCSNCNRGKYRNGGICPHKTNNLLYANGASDTKRL